MKSYLIVGLGNPGEEYAQTRHNVGFRVLDALMAHSFAGSRWANGRYGLVADVSYRGRTLRLLKPSTYMNCSGRAVRYHVQDLRIAAAEQLLVVADELALPFGILRLRARGSDGGHNGLKDIQGELVTQDYPRLRVGIGNHFAQGAQVDYVLERFSPSEEAMLPAVLSAAGQALLSFVFRGIAPTMSDFNRTWLPEPPPTAKTSGPEPPPTYSPSAPER